MEISAGIWLDHRRAVYLEAERILCVADLHLGYAWAHRFSGQLMPLRGEEDLLCIFNLGDKAVDWVLPADWRVVEQTGEPFAPLSGVIAERAG